MVLSTFMMNKMTTEYLCKLATETALLKRHKLHSLFLTLTTLEEKCCVISSYRHLIVLREAKSLTHCLFLCLELQPGFFFLLSPPLMVSEEDYYGVSIKQGKTVFNN